MVKHAKRKKKEYNTVGKIKNKVTLGYVLHFNRKLLLYGLWTQVEISILGSEFSCSCAVNTRIITKYYKQTARVIILKSNQNKTNHFEMLMKSFYGLCNSELQQIYAFFYIMIHRGTHYYLLLYMTYRPREEDKKTQNCL